MKRAGGDANERYAAMARAARDVVSHSDTCGMFGSLYHGPACPAQVHACIAGGKGSASGDIVEQEFEALLMFDAKVEWTILRRHLHNSTASHNCRVFMQNSQVSHVYSADIIVYVRPSGLLQCAQP